MNRSCGTAKSRSTDDGFTLVEVLIVITILGLIMSVLAAAFSVIVRTTPTTEVRIGDARSTRGLATWLSHDTTSAPPYSTYHAQGWIDLAPGRNDCGGAGENVMHLTWVENATSPITYHTNYRYVASDGIGTVVRYTCSSIEGTEHINLTAGLATKPTIVLHESSGEVRAVDFVLTAPSGEQVVVQTGSRNPMEYFP